MNKSGGIEFTVKGNFKEAEARARLNKAIKRAQMKLDTQVINDSNYFIPHITGTLEDSAVINTVIGSGLVKWKTDYARRQYYGIDFDHSKQSNPNARSKWFEAAKAQKIEQWRKLVNDEIQHS